MGQSLFVGLLCVMVVAAGVWGWWLENKKQSVR